jgi:SDR family mycofactocin-dependent oxidoreductase
MGKLDGRVAYITGAARGQGRSHAVRLAEEGADIVATDICSPIDIVPYALASEEDLKETGRLVEATGRRVLLARADVRSRPELQRAFDDGVSEFGKIDVVVANAGVCLTGTPDPDEDKAMRVGLDVLLIGVWNTFQTAIPHMVSREGGVIVATSSTAGIRAFTDGRGSSDAYTAAKTAIVGLVKAYAAFLGQHNIRVNAVAPSAVATDMVIGNTAMMDVINASPHISTSMSNALPVDLLEPRDVSDVVAFLVSDDSRYITGSTIAVDAGSLL